MQAAEYGNGKTGQRLLMVEVSGGAEENCSLLSSPSPPFAATICLQMTEATLECMSPLDGMVIEMESSRCRMVAIEIDDPRGKSLITGVAIEMEDLRCRSLRASVVIEPDDRRCHRIGIEMEILVARTSAIGDGGF